MFNEMKLSAFAFLLLSGLPGAILLPLAAQSPHRLDKSSWRLDAALSEEFDRGTTLATLAPRWYVDLGPEPVVNKNSPLAFEPYITRDNISFADGYAYLHTYKHKAVVYQANNRDYHYSAAYLRSRGADLPTINPSGDTSQAGLLYGMFEIRCKLPAGSGQYPSFWLSGDNAWPPEIDAFEFNGSHPKVFFSTVHWPNPAFAADTTAAQDSSRGQMYAFRRRKYLTKSFHTWTVVWTPSQVTWFLDDKELYTDSVAAHIPGSLTPGTNPYELGKYRKMDLIINSVLNYPDSAATVFEPFIIDYIRVYRPAGVGAYNTSQPLGDYLNTLSRQYQQAPYRTRGRGVSRRRFVRQLPPPAKAAKGG